MTSKLTDWTDEAAMAECRRLSQVIWSRQREHARWLGQDESPHIFDENCAFVTGMTAMFRYARGEEVPAFIVKSFIDELLVLMFCGLASNHLALPGFNRMQDKPWATAWRMAELRLMLEGEEEIEKGTLAHLLGISVQALEERIHRAFPERTDPNIPNDFIRSILMNLRDEPQDN